MNPIKSHISTLLISIVMFVIAAIGYGYMANSIDRTTANAKSLKDARFNDESSVVQSKAVSFLYSVTAVNRKSMNDIIVTDTGIVELIAAIEKIGNISGSKLAISSISTMSPVSSSTNSKVVGITFTATGSWNAVMKTLMLVENIDFSASVDKVRLDASIDGLWSMAVQLQIPVFSK